jgi:hypothetical protein
MKKRDEATWEIQYKHTKLLFQTMEQAEDVVAFARSMRNPIIFDNNVSQARTILPYYLPVSQNEKQTKDHLISCSNIVLYIFKNEIYKKWNSYQDFIATLKAFQVLLTVPKSLNDSKSFKSWIFGVDDINECIRWDIKLKRENIHYLFDEEGKEKSVDVIYSQWYQENKNFL